MRNLIRIFALSGVLLAYSAANSHGLTEPQHGGVLTTSGDWTFELLDTADGVKVYLFNDTVPFDTAGMKAKIKIDHLSSSIDVALEPAGENTLVAKDLDIGKGATVLVVVTLSDGYSKVGGRFNSFE